MDQHGKGLGASAAHQTCWYAQPATVEGGGARAALGSGPRRVAILGTRGLPPRHGGFESLVAQLAPWLVRRGWNVEVYCQDDTPEGGPEEWNGVRLAQVSIRAPGSLGAVEFDLRSTLRTLDRETVVLTLGYNTAIFGLLYKLFGVINVVNMDGLEWKRSKWPAPVRWWFWLNERAATRLADYMIADHPAIAERLGRISRSAQFTTIPYGAEAVRGTDPTPLAAHGLVAGGYAVVIARIEKENQLLEIVRAFSRRARGIRLVVLGNLYPDVSPYHAAVRDAAGPEVMFPGAIYDPAAVATLREHAAFYVHGHTVGGTNPSLVEALGAGCPVVAHDNPFNRWVAGEAQAYFTDDSDLDARISELLATPATLKAMSAESRRRHAENFQWEPVLLAYEQVLLEMARTAAPAKQGQ